MGMISRLYTFVNGNKAMAQQVNAEFDQLVNAHNSNEGVIATIQGQISTELATKKELANVTLGLIPDDTITQQKLAPSLRDALPAQYVRNRIPASADNYAAGHKIGDAWYIPDITLNNLVPTPLAINTADFTIQNANASASGSAVTLSCLGGFDFASFKRTITPVAGALYVLFAELKLTSTHVLTSLSLNDQVIANPVKDTVYRVAQIVTAPTQIEIKAQALDGTALNGATVVIYKLTIVNMTADMDGVPFDKAGAEAYFQANPAFLTHKLNNAKTRWYCSDNGVWQSSSQLTDATAKMYGVKTVDEALRDVLESKPINLMTYRALAGNVNTSDLCAGFVPCKAGEYKNHAVQMGQQIAKYILDFISGSTLSAEEIEAFNQCNDWWDVAGNPVCRTAINRYSTLTSKITSIYFANFVYQNSLTNEYLFLRQVETALSIPQKSFKSIDDLKRDVSAMQGIFGNASLRETIQKSYYLLNRLLTNTQVVINSGTVQVPSGVDRLGAILIGAGFDGTDGVNTTTAGIGGDCGKTLSVYLDTSAGGNLNVSIGKTSGANTELSYQSLSYSTSNGARLKDVGATILPVGTTGPRTVSINGEDGLAGKAYENMVKSFDIVNIRQFFSDLFYIEKFDSSAGTGGAGGAIPSGAGTGYDYTVPVGGGGKGFGAGGGGGSRQCNGSGSAVTPLAGSPGVAGSGGQGSRGGTKPGLGGKAGLGAIILFW